MAAGFQAHGLKGRVTADRAAGGDVHVVLGPHYARDWWIGQHPNVLYLDRCYYRGDPAHVSLGWLRPDGGREWQVGTGREPPPVPPPPPGRGRVFLADFAGPQQIVDADYCRTHPARQAPAQPLEAVLARYHTAIGYRTSALVTAALAGLVVECRWPPHLVNRPDWREVLPYADWSREEIARGEAWEHLRHARGTDSSTG